MKTLTPTQRSRARQLRLVDFCCLEAGLVVELDGSQHAEEQLDHDRQRTAFLGRQGFRVVRFWNNELCEDFEQVLERIYFFALGGTTSCARILSKCSNESTSSLWADLGARRKSGKPLNPPHLSPLPSGRGSSCSYRPCRNDAFSIPIALKVRQAARDRTKRQRPRCPSRILSGFR